MTVDHVSLSLRMLSRTEAVAALAAEPFDVLVVGGGITGAGVALDAATRGYSVALVERADFASGTSSRSSKLIHGGLRYLQNLDLALVREALVERQINASLAPHLVRPLGFVMPTFDGARRDRMVPVALSLYDAMAVRRRGAPGGRPARHRTLSGAEVAELVPALAERSPSGGYLFYDCQTDDARLVLTVLAEAERFGAVAANRLDAVALLEERGRVCGARVRDRESGDELEVRAAGVINATGVWADRLGPAHDVPLIRPSRGTHLVIDGDALPMRAGTVVPAAGGRSIFVLPWLGGTLIGTTDNDYEGDLDHVRPGEADVEYLLDAVNAFFPAAVGPGDVVGAFAGVRPLIASGDPRKSVDISRRAQIYVTAGGMITITGGKLTTWRRMAKLAVDRIVERDGARAPCRTDRVPLGTAIAPDDLDAAPGVREHLAARYGHVAHDVVALAERPELAEPIVAGRPDLLAEVVHAARREQARTVGDVLLRRTRLGLTAARPLLAGDAVERVAAAMGQALGWDAVRRAREADAFRAEAEAEGILPGA